MDSLHLNIDHNNFYVVLSYVVFLHRAYFTRYTMYQYQIAIGFVKNDQLD